MDYQHTTGVQLIIDPLEGTETPQDVARYEDELRVQLIIDPLEGTETIIVDLKQWARLVFN